MIAEIFSRLPIADVRNAALVCSSWASLPLSVRACCEHAEVLVASNVLPRLPRVIPAAVELKLWLNGFASGRPSMTREEVSAALAGAPRLASLDLEMSLDQLPMLTEALSFSTPGVNSDGDGGNGGSGGGGGGQPALPPRRAPHLTRLRVSLICPEGAAAGFTDAQIDAAGAAFAAYAPALERLEVMDFLPWTYVGERNPAQALLLSIVANNKSCSSSSNNSGGNSGGNSDSKLKELRGYGTILTSAVIACLKGSFGIRKIRLLDVTALSAATPRLFIPQFPAGRGVSHGSLRELEFELLMEDPTGQGRWGPPATGISAYCDVGGVSAEQALAPVAASVTRLVLDFRGRDKLPRLLFLPSCFRALRNLRSLAVRYPRLTSNGVLMPSETRAGAAAVRAAAAATGGGIAFARARALSGAAGSSR